ncbi:hypothetical protein GCM10011506_05120 [Marivirga lumbricoides]|uniref:Elp3/MiaA/NifB-like radical SAM core domain-containing protein n=1 Tax=Marivirga lumbricoides TaxID=1046115 RepID=A0ABQ1LCF9_9BACT|nr:hypothetical protein GCM10011506_05120 [Marivirga lumbricoides]
MKKLRAFAVTAPHWIKSHNPDSQTSLNSREPFSLQNAIRLCVKAASNKEDEWYESNWSCRERLKESIMLYEYFQNQLDDYISRIQSIKPNLIVICTMTLGYPGAIEIASVARKTLGDQVFIAIGGKHIIETTFLDESGELGGNKSCTLRQMIRGEVPKVFDLVVSGDGEEVIYELGKIIVNLEDKFSVSSVLKKADSLALAKGNWIGGYIESNEISYLVGNEPLNQDILPFPCEFFYSKSHFPVFDSDVTFHAYSYMSKGCPFDCFFCSEKRQINGMMSQSSTAPNRLYQQFSVVSEKTKAVGHKASIFVEDSVFLGGNVKLLDKFHTLMEGSELDIEFGMQYTVDLLQKESHREAIRKLNTIGLTYVFIGIETNVEEIAETMNKNTDKKTPWMTKAKSIIEFLHSYQINCGFSILYGLGETHRKRIEILEQLKKWQSEFQQPKVVSLNLATLHPLQQDGDESFTKWGTSSFSDYLPIFTQIFGEASVMYSLKDKYIGTVEELKEIKVIYDNLNKLN